MKTTDDDTREKLIRAALELLQTEQDTGRVTVRQIAAKAGVNSALVNYYFRSKENLFNEAVGRQMAQIAAHMLGTDRREAPPEERLHEMIRAMSDFSFDNYFLSSIIIASDLKKGSVETCRLLLPLLRQLHPKRSEMALNLLALQVVVPFQVLFLNAEVYSTVLNEDLFQKASRDRVIAALTEQALREVKS